MYGFKCRFIIQNALGFWMLRLKRFVMVKIKQNQVVNVISVKVAGKKRPDTVYKNRIK
jgi:hypothetical protein